jgi:hypothetical protein
MKLHDVIGDYLAHQQSIGRIFTRRRYLLLAFNRAVGREVEIQHVDPNRVIAFLGRPTTRYWHDKYYALL